MYPTYVWCRRHLLSLCEVRHIVENMAHDSNRKDTFVSKLVWMESKRSLLIQSHVPARFIPRSLRKFRSKVVVSHSSVCPSSNQISVTRRSCCQSDEWVRQENVRWNGVVYCNANTFLWWRTTSSGLHDTTPIFKPARCSHHRSKKIRPKDLLSLFSNWCWTPNCWTSLCRNFSRLLRNEYHQIRVS